MYNASKTFLLMSCSAVVPFFSFAQCSLNAQLRTRTEFRNGVGTLRAYGASPSFFTSQRTRLSAGYHHPLVQFKLTVQDVRVWGQDASSISPADGSRLSVHEAWAELVLQNRSDSSRKSSKLDYLGVRIGRQELLYDDARLLGNLDWLQQGRRHDALVLKLKEKNIAIDAGFAFSQNTDAFGYNGTFYTPANVAPTVRDSKGSLAASPAGFIPLVNAENVSTKNGAPAILNPASTNAAIMQYKSMQFLYAAYKKKNTTLSFLLLTDQFGKRTLDSVRNISGSDTGYIYGWKFKSKGVYARITTGLQMSGSLDQQKKWTYKAGCYFQGGKNKDGTGVAASMVYGSVSWQPSAFAFTLGYDRLSGNDAFDKFGKDHRFDPLYGTPHKFWGYMDYFYVATGSPAGGLSNPQTGVKYTGVKKKFTISADYHAFFLAGDMKNVKSDKADRYLGSELDFATIYQFNSFISLEGGLSFLKAGSSMELAKGLAPGTASRNASWVWLMVNIRPELLKR